MSGESVKKSGRPSLDLDLDSTPLGSPIEGKSEGFLRALSIQLAALLRNFIACRKNCPW